MSDVPFLKKEVIEAEALSLLTECGQGTALPVPIDDIVELHLKLTLEIMDLQQIFGVGDVHDAIWFQLQRVGVDLSLDPSRHPTKLGRYRFTLAHEVGHWRLHRHLYLHRSNQQSLFPSSQASPDHVLRSRQCDPLEFQANRLASCLLMPREIVKRAWHAWRGGMEPIYLPDLRAEAGDWGTDEIVLANAVRPLADLFQVSAEAMRIRLEEMGLLLRKREVSLFVTPSLANLEDISYGKG